VVCQTTIRKELFESIIDALEAKGCKLEIKNTICNATSLRQDACQRLAKEVDAMIIIGDKQSSNTKKLYEIAKKHCKNLAFI